ncbi:MAG: hypothetical protein GY714_20610 [Desulfobacterales bacterium]|nr:hypothetical protein [Desulfobacterales bacterium]
MKVKITEIADELQMQFDESSSYYNTADGKFYLVSDDDFDEAEEANSIEDLPEWQQDSIRIARQIISTNNFIELPSRYHIHEYSIIEEFCYSIDDSKISETLQVAIQGRGAFGRFKEACHQFDIIDQWYLYKTKL